MLRRRRSVYLRGGRRTSSRTARRRRARHARVTPRRGAGAGAGAGATSTIVNGSSSGATGMAPLRCVCGGRVDVPARSRPSGVLRPRAWACSGGRPRSEDSWFGSSRSASDSRRDRRSAAVRRTTTVSTLSSRRRPATRAGRRRRSARGTEKTPRVRILYDVRFAAPERRAGRRCEPTVPSVDVDRGTAWARRLVKGARCSSAKVNDAPDASCPARRRELRSFSSVRYVLLGSWSSPAPIRVLVTRLHHAGRTAARHGSWTEPCKRGRPRFPIWYRRTKAHFRERRSPAGRRRRTSRPGR